MTNSQYFQEKFKIWTGVIVFAYVVTHYLNHSLGLISLEAMESGRHIFTAIWRNPVMNYVVVASLLLHAFLAIAKLARKKSFRSMTGYEWTQLVIGIIAPLALTPHILHTKYVHEAYGIEDSYFYVLFLDSAGDVAAGVILMFLVWWHAIIGIRKVLLLRPGFPSWQKTFDTAAVIIPILGASGVAAGFRQAKLAAAADPSAAQDFFQGIADAGFNLESWKKLIDGIAIDMLIVYLTVLGTAFGGRWILLTWRKRHHAVRIEYADGNSINVARGTNLLEASMHARIPHAHVCGGKGRCSTCRIRIYEGFEHLEPASPPELRVLKQIGAAPNVRLACQTYPLGACRVLPILPADTMVRGLADQRFLQGADRKIAILFADLRGFTSFAEQRLPFDVVFVLNQYFQSVGRAVENRGGYLDKYIGDGAMALFGLNGSLATGCRQAIEAAWEMGHELDLLNKRLADELKSPLRIGIGIHCGDTIVGKMGYKHTSHLTAIGDAVNIASRLESMTKEFEAQLVVSGDVVKAAGLDLTRFQTAQVSIRGRVEPLDAYVVPQVGDLPVSAITTQYKANHSSSNVYAPRPN